VGTVTVIVVACAVVTAALGGFRFFNALDQRRGLSLPWLFPQQPLLPLPSYLHLFPVTGCCYLSRPSSPECLPC
jgi:hypothetical protein